MIEGAFPRRRDLHRLKVGESLEELRIREGVSGVMALSQSLREPRVITMPASAAVRQEAALRAADVSVEACELVETAKPSSAFQLAQEGPAPVLREPTFEELLSGRYKPGALIEVFAPDSPFSDWSPEQRAASQLVFGGRAGVGAEIEDPAYLAGDPVKVLSLPPYEVLMGVTPGSKVVSLPVEIEALVVAPKLVPWLRPRGRKRSIEPPQHFRARRLR